MTIFPDGFLQTVAFLCQETDDEFGAVYFKPRATGFFVRVPSTEAGLSFDYFVTARHCLTKARIKERPIGIRVAMDGGIFEHGCSIDNWWEHDTADVAAMMMLPSALPKGATQQNVRQSSLNLATFVGSDYFWRGIVPNGDFQEIRPSVGTEICFPGLFTHSYGGDSTNLPLVRFGHIARMPSMLSLESGGIQLRLIGYLADATSFGGFSGAPVFFLHPLTFHDEDNPKVVVATGHASGFLGLVTGHYPSQVDTARDEDEATTNSGIAIITPAAAVLELLMRDDIMEHRDRLAARVVESRRAGSPVVLDWEDAEEFTKPDFEHALRKVSRRTTPPSLPDESSSETSE